MTLVGVKALYTALGVFGALVIPGTAGWATHKVTGSVALAALVGAIVVYELMAISVAAMSIAEHIPDDVALGPSFLTGTGLLTLGMVVAPWLVMPGLVWMWVLPVDEQGHFDRSAVARLDGDRVEVPHHA